MIKSCKKPPVYFPTVTGDICSFNSQYAGLPLKSCTSLITGYQEGSGTPSPSNVRPLHAWSSANLTATGKNLFDKSNNIGRYLDGSLTIRTNAEFKSVYVELKPNTTYTYSQTESGNYKRYALSNSLEEYAEFVNPVDHSSHLYLSETPFTFNSGDYKYLICTIYRISDTKTFDEIANSCQLELGQQATAYEPFGNSYTFTFGQSIFQGSIDWKRGVVVGTWGIDVYDGSNDENWGVQSIAGFRIDNTAKKVGRGNYLADNYQATNLSGWDISTPNGYFSGHPTLQRFYFRTPYDGFEVTLENWRSWLSSNPITVVYELATPIEIPLGGINLLTQQGQNNIFANCGNTTLEYLKAGR